MEFRKLFDDQRVLMERIEKEHPPAKGEDRFKKRGLALLVELGECANEYRGFKFWSKDQKPRVKAKCEVCDGLGEIYEPYHDACFACDETGFNKSKNPLLEELVDVLHFVLEHGLVTNTVDHDFLETLEFPDVPEVNVVEYFMDLYESIYLFISMPTKRTYGDLIIDFIYLASALGFTWEEVTDAYFQKNLVNHRRQNDGY